MGTASNNRDVEINSHITKNVLDDLLQRFLSIHLAEIELSMDEEGSSVQDWCWQNLDTFGNFFYNEIEEHLGWDKIELPED